MVFHVYNFLGRDRGLLVTAAASTWSEAGVAGAAWRGTTRRRTPGTSWTSRSAAQSRNTPPSFWTGSSDLNHNLYPNCDDSIKMNLKCINITLRACWFWIKQQMFSFVLRTHARAALWKSWKKYHEFPTSWLGNKTFRIGWDGKTFIASKTNIWNSVRSHNVVIIRVISNPGLELLLCLIRQN